MRGHEVILFGASQAFATENEWLEARLDGGRIVLHADSITAIYATTVSGLGIGFLPRAVADEDPTVQRLTTRTFPEPRVIWQMVHRDLQKPLGFA